MTMLKESLSRFNKQQEKWQSTLASIAANAGPSRAPTQKSPAPGTSTSVGAGSPLPPRFSEDTGRLQQIHSVRKAPTGSQIKRVIDLLRLERQAFTPEQINERIYVDIIGNKAVFDSLSKNPKVKYDGHCFSYKAKHDLSDKNHLLALIQKFPEGIPVIDLKDSYPTVMEDLQALKADRKIWLLSNNDSKEDIAYPNDPRVPTMEVDDDLKQLFLGIELPRDMIDVEKELQKNGMKPATETAKRRAKAQVDGIAPKPKAKKTKERKISKRTKLTNKHMPELFNL